MADRRPPGFNVDLGFYDSPEVLSIPRKHRAAAVGVWTLCGAYSANKLTDGHVSAEKLRELGCTSALRDALMATTPEPLWVAAEPAGAIQFTRWTKWQRTRAEVKAYRDADAERKRVTREANKRQLHTDVDANHSPRERQLHNLVDVNHGPDGTYLPPETIDKHVPNDGGSSLLTSENSPVSEECPPGQRQDVRLDDRDPRGPARARQTKTETKTKTETSLTLVEGGPGGDPQNLPVAAKSAPGDARGKRIPEDWRPTDATIASMRQQFPQLDLKEIHVEFCDYWRAIPGARGRRTDWDATWRNRVREIAARQRAPTNNGHHTPAGGVGKPTQKALGYQQAAERVIAQMENKP